MPSCSVAGCERSRYAGGFCHGHYQRVRRLGHPDADVPIGGLGRRTCIVAGCGRFRRGRGYCDGHYRRWQRHGDPQAGKPLKARRDKREPWTDAKGYVYLYRPGHPNAET